MQQQSGEVILAEGGFIRFPHVLSEFQRAVVAGGWRIEDIGEQPDHQAFLGLRRVACESERMIGVDVAV